MIGKQRSQLRGISKGGAQCTLPCDFPVKSDSQIYLINVGICLLIFPESYAVFQILVIFVPVKAIWGRHVCGEKNHVIIIRSTVSPSTFLINLALKNNH